MAVRTVDRAAVRTWRPKSGNRVVAPDGTTLTIKHESAALEEPWFIEARVRFSGNAAASEIGGRAFETGPVGTVDGHVAVLLEGSYVAEYPAQGGTFLLAQRADRSAGLVAWQGRWHEAYAWVNEPNASHAKMLASFEGMTFADGPAGLRVGLAAGETYQKVTVTKHIPGIGFLKATQAAAAATSLPTWSGLKVRSGEVWRQVSDADTDVTPVLVCAAPTAVVALHPRGGTEDEGLSFLTGLSSITWR